MTVRERIFTTMKRKGITQRELAARIGVSPQTVTDWKPGGKELNSFMDYLSQIAEALGVSVGYLVADDRETEETDLDENAVRIPVLGRIPAGVPIAAIREIEDWTNVPACWLRSAEYFALRVKGRSMEPTIHDGSIVIVRVQDCCDSGQICIVSIDGEDATCKRVHWDADGGMTLYGDNPEFTPMHYSAREVQDRPVRIVGRVKRNVTDF